MPKTRKVNYYTGKKKPTTRSSCDKRRWTKEEYKIAIECRIRAENDINPGGIGKKALKFWEEKNMFEMTENKLMNQIRVINNKGWLTPVEIEMIRRQVERRTAGELETDQRYVGEYSLEEAVGEAVE